MKTSKIVSLKATAKKGKTVLTWKKTKGQDFDGYKISRATAKNGKYKVVKTTSSKTFTTKVLKKGKTNYFKVRGYKVFNGETFYTPYKTVRVKAK